MLREVLPPIDAYLADGATLSEDEFLARYPWPWLVLPEPSQDILSQIQRPETVVARAQSSLDKLTDGPKLQGASLDALCLEVRPVRGDADCMTVGRAPEADVVLLHDSVSRRHAEFRFRDGQSLIRDLGAKNGSSLGGSRLEPDRWTPLPDGAVLRLGLVVMRHYGPRGFLDWVAQGAPRSGAAPGRWPEPEPPSSGD